MGKQTTTIVTCDVCGEQIYGDWMEVKYSQGDSWVIYYIHPSRTGALDPCGNRIIRALKRLFPKVHS